MHAVLVNGYGEESSSKGVVALEMRQCRPTSVKIFEIDYWAEMVKN